MEFENLMTEDSIEEIICSERYLEVSLHVYSLLDGVVSMKIRVWLIVMDGSSSFSTESNHLVRFIRRQSFIYTVRLRSILLVHAVD